MIEGCGFCFTGGPPKYLSFIDCIKCKEQLEGILGTARSRGIYDLSSELGSIICPFSRELVTRGRASGAETNS
jgi:hypothetical protein